MPYTYILYSTKLNKYYVGACTNLERRLYEHNIGHSKFTSTGVPWVLQYQEYFDTLPEDADIMCFGHTHKPYHRILPTYPGKNPHYHHAINIGSVGKPKDNNPKECYVILTINADSSITNKDAVQVEFIRFEYDVEKAAKAVEESPLPNEYAEMSRKGY